MDACTLLKHPKLLLDVDGLLRGAGLDLEHVEANRLGEGAALAHSDDITLLDALESGRAVSGDVPVAFLVPLVLANVVKVVPPHDDGALHLGGHNEALENTSTDGDVSGEGALLVNVGALDRLLRRLEAEADLLPVAKLARLVLAASHALATNRRSYPASGTPFVPAQPFCLILINV